MVELHWPNETTFLAPSGQYRGPGVHDVPDEREEQFRERGWQDPPDENDADSTAETGGSDASDGVAPPFPPGEFTVAELDARMADSDHTDAEREALIEAERDGENRSGAIEVLEP